MTVSPSPVSPVILRSEAESTGQQQPPEPGSHVSAMLETSRGTMLAGALAAGPAPQSFPPLPPTVEADAPQARVAASSVIASEAARTKAEESRVRAEADSRVIAAEKATAEDEMTRLRAQLADAAAAQLAAAAAAEDEITQLRAQLATERQVKIAPGACSGAGDGDVKTAPDACSGAGGGGGGGGDGRVVVVSGDVRGVTGVSGGGGGYYWPSADVATMLHSMQTCPFAALGFGMMMARHVAAAPLAPPASPAPPATPAPRW